MPEHQFFPLSNGPQNLADSFVCLGMLKLIFLNGCTLRNTLSSSSNVLSVLCYLIDFSLCFELLKYFVAPPSWFNRDYKALTPLLDSQQFLDNKKEQVSQIVRHRESCQWCYDKQQYSTNDAHAPLVPMPSLQPTINE